MSSKWGKIMIDVLTGNKNREAFELRINGLIQDHQAFTLLLASIDKFATINDFYGHACGDRVLVIVGQALEELDNIEVFRCSGSQFVILILSQELADIDFTIHEIRRCIRLKRLVHHIKADLTVSIGISQSSPSNSIEHYYNQLNLALRYARSEGQGETRFYNAEFEKKLFAEMALREAIDGAMRQDEFELYMQPLYFLDKRTIMGFEILLRWPNRARMDLNIGEIIESAEKSGQIMALDKWVVTHTFKLIKEYPAIFLDKKVCINISAQSFLSYDFLKFYLREEEKYTIDPKFIELEITEYSMMHNLKRTIRMMMIYKGRGIQFALDDFGTKYSSINYLKELPFDTLKIDKSYIDSICEDSKSKAIVRVILDLCRELGLSTISEGIETVEQENLLKQMGCDFGQGYYFEKPMPIRDLIQLVS